VITDREEMANATYSLDTVGLYTFLFIFFSHTHTHTQFFFNK